MIITFAILPCNGNSAMSCDWRFPLGSLLCTSLHLQVTHLFKGVLHGNGRFVMVVNVSPASEAFNETKRVLQVC